MTTRPDPPVPATPAGVRHPPRLLWAAGVGAVGIAVLLVVGFALGRRPFLLDRTVMLSVHDAGPDWVRRAMIDVTALGGGTVLTLVVLGVAGALLVRRAWLTALLLAVATWSGGRVVDLMKGVFERSRPDIVEHLVQASGTSFPSGHSANSALVYLTVAGLATQVLRGRAVRRYVVAVAILLTGMIGISRVYLGVHWPSDVLVGWSFGTLWALAWWLAASKARTLYGGE